MANVNEQKSSTADREIIITRLLNAPKELVFDVWTDPKHIAQWYGPEGITSVTKQMDVRPGGTWIFTMHAPDGTEYPNRIIYSAVEKPNLLVYKHDSGFDNDPREFHVTITFKEEQGKTRITMHSVFTSAAELEKVVKIYRAIEGGNQTLDRFEKTLAQFTGGPKKELVITRTFNASREKVFKAWSSADALAQWWGPKGLKVEVSNLDFRPGGTFHYCMKAPDGNEMWGLFVYRDITAPERIEFISSFSNEEGVVAAAPFFDGKFPKEILNVVTFAENNGKTTLTIKGGPVNATEAEREIYNSIMGNMEEGFGSTFDQLDEYLLTGAN